jgi:hypothetical protein
VVDRGRWARAERLLVCRRTGLGRSKNRPPVRPDRDSGAWWVVWLRSELDKKSEALLSSPLRTSDLYRRATLPDHGVRERPTAVAGCHATPLAQGIGLLRIQGETMPDELARPHCVCEQRWCVWGVATAGQSNFSQLKLSVVPGESISSPTRLQIVCKVVVNAFQQYEWLLSLATAKR